MKPPHKKGADIDIGAFLDRIREDEREACAQLAETEARRLREILRPDNPVVIGAMAAGLEKLAAAIRARETGL